MRKTDPLVDAVEVKVHPTIAGPGNRGTRRRAGLTFSARPTYLAPGEVPKAVKQDPFLLTRKAKVQRGKFSPVPGEPTVAPVAPLPPSGKPTTGPLTKAQQIEVKAISEEIQNVGPKTAEVLVRAGYGLEDTRIWASITHLTAGELEGLGLGPAQVKAVTAWKGLPSITDITEKLKAERIQ
jgi:hypothetical protein